MNVSRDRSGRIASNGDDSVPAVERSFSGEAPKRDATLPTIVLVHGAWHGSWCWSEVQKRLGAVGHDVITVDLPTVHAGNASELGLADDVATVAAAIESAAGEVVVVAHSYGGVPASIASTVPAVVKLVFLAAFVLDEGEALGAPGPDEKWWVVEGAMTRPVNRTEASSVFYQDVAHELAEDATGRLRPQALRAFTDPVTAAGWRNRPVTYVVTQRDKALPVEDQYAFAERAGAAVVTLDTGHSPFLSRPHTVADIVNAAAIG
jgi:pimeloyl-ACP methyl ester carboxylesterase